MKILVIIVSYNFERWMDACLGSLAASDHPVSVVVIDNNSFDHTVEELKTRYPHIRLIENKDNLGFGAANNIGMKLALDENYDVVLLLNQDAWVDKNTIGTLAGLIKTHPEYAVLSPVHLNGKGTALDYGFATYSGLEAHSPLPENNHLTEVPFINAAIWLMPVKILKTIGGFSPLFYHYGEDKDYVNRIKYHSYKVGYCSGVYGYHDRENREPTRTAFFRAERTYLLSEYANINYSFSRAFALGVLAGIKKALISLKQGKLNDCSTFLSITFGLLSKTGKVINTRKNNIRKGANYFRP